MFSRVLFASPVRMAFTVARVVFAAAVRVLLARVRPSFFRMLFFAVPRPESFARRGPASGVGEK